MDAKSLAYNTLPGPDDITRHELPNGITLLIRSNFLSPSVIFTGYLDCGSISDPDDKLGLANLTASALTTGTKKQDFNTLHNAIETLGANLSVHGGTLTTSFSSQCLVEDLPTMLGIFADVLQQPTFPRKQFKRLKAQYLTMLAIIAQDTAEMADLTFNELIFKGHPFERSDDGTPETISAIGVEDLVEFHQNHFSPQGMVMAVVGAVEPEDVIKYVSDRFGAWSDERKRLSPLIPDALSLEQPASKHVTIVEKSQTDIVMGNLAPRRASGDYLPCAMGNNILGQFGMMGRIGNSVREKSGLAYYAQSDLSAGTGPGTWEFVAGVNPENLNKVVTLIKEEMQHFLDDPVSDDELNDTKSYLIGRLPLLHESNSGVAVSLLNLERFNLGLDYLRNYPELVQSITKEDILTASRKYLSLQSLAVASAGKALR